MRVSLLSILASAALSHAGCFRGVCSQYSFDLEESINTDWMSKIPDPFEVAYLSIPGTHNSMTDQLGRHKLLQSQNANLAQQLRAGIRYIDISGRLRGDKIKLYYGNRYTDYDLDDILNTAFDFLDEYPHEALILRLHKGNWSSGEEDAFEDAVREYLESTNFIALRAHYRIYHGSTNGVIRSPTLGAIRGRVLLLQDFHTTFPARYGIPWRSKAMTVSNWKFIPGYIAMGVKWSLVKSAITAASQAWDYRLHITYTSVSIGATPYKAAGGKTNQTRGINDRLGEFLSAGTVPRTGIVVMDFPGKDLINQIIRLNEQSYS